MKILIIGASGTIGKHVTAALEKDHEVIRVGSKSGDMQVNIESADSIKAFFEKVKSFDALVSATGNGHFGLLKSMPESDFRKSIDSKLMGQVNLVLTGQHYINPGGSFTLTSGIMSHEPIKMGVSVSTVNGALNSFVRAAAIELENNVRINAVSPGVVEESPHYFGAFPGQIPVTMSRVTQAYIRSVLGAGTGRVFEVN